MKGFLVHTVSSMRKLSDSTSRTGDRTSVSAELCASGYRVRFALSSPVMCRVGPKRFICISLSFRVKLGKRLEVPPKFLQITRNCKVASQFEMDILR